MYNDINEAKEYIEEMIVSAIEEKDYLTAAFNLVNFDYNNITLDSTSIKAAEKSLIKADEMIQEFSDFIYNWQEKVSDIAEKEYEEYYKDDYESFEKFIYSKDGESALSRFESALEMAQEIIQDMISEDENLQAVDEMLRNLREEVDERNVKGVIKRVTENIDKEFDDLKNMLSESLPRDIIIEAFD
jgi:hypothetical protein